MRKKTAVYGSSLKRWQFVDPSGLKRGMPKSQMLETIKRNLSYQPKKGKSE